MASLPEFDTKDPDYVNWVKAGLVLRQLRAGLQDFLDREMRQVHTDILTNVQQQLPPNTALRCTACSARQLNNPRYKCPNKVCSVLLKEIKARHLFADPRVKNADVNVWTTDSGYWEVAKCFLPDGGASMKTAATTDCSGLLSLVINCTAVHAKIHTNLNTQTNVFTQVRSLRNVVMHSPSLSLSGGELSQLVRDSLAILNDRTSLKLDPVAQKAAGNIEKIEKETLEISMKDQLTVLEEVKQAMENSRRLEELRGDLEERLQTQETKFETDLTTQQEKIESFQSHQDKLEEQRTKTEVVQTEKIRLLEAVIDSVKTSMEMLEENIKTQVQGLTKGTEEVKEDIRVLETRVISLESHGTLEEISPEDEGDLKQDLLTKYTDLLSSVRVSKWSKKLKIGDIFTPIIIREDLEQQMAEQALDRMKSNLQFPTVKPALISAYDEVFLRDKVMQSDIYVIGKAGIGKSLFALQLVNLWCKVQSCGPNSSTERLLKDFQFVFYVACRYAKKPKESEDWDSLKDLVLKQNCLGDKRYENIAKQILESGTKQCLILVDGLDEWAASASERSSPVSRPGIPDRQGLKNCVILTTSRPWRIEALPDGVGRACRVLEIVGLDQDGVKELSGNLLKALKESNPDAAVESFLEELNDLKMRELVKVPLMLTNIVVSWHDSGHELDKSLCLNYSGMVESLILRSGKTPAPLSSDESEACIDRVGLSAIPRCFQKRTLCCHYWPLILKLSKLAFDSLFGQEREKSLVFSKQDLVSRLGEKDLGDCLKIGILSQSEADTESVMSMVTISFLHKSVQEFLAAVWICVDESDKCVDIFKRQCKSLDDAFDYNVIILFVCGLAPIVGSQLCRHILTLAEDNTVVRQHRETAEYEYKGSRTFAPASLIVKVEELLLDCTREAAEDQQLNLQTLARASQRENTSEHASSKPDERVRKTPSGLAKLIKKSLKDMTNKFSDSKTQQKVPEPIQQLARLFVIPDVFVDAQLTAEARDALYTQASINGPYIKSLVFTDDVFTPEQMMIAVKNMRCLERLYITSAADQANKCMDHIHKNLRQWKNLKSLGLDVDGKPRPVFSERTIKSVFDLLNSSKESSSLYLAGLEVKPVGNPSGDTASKAVKPKSSPLFPQTLTSITSLDLRILTMSHAQIEELCACLKKSINLQRLALWKVRCRDCSEMTCQYNMDLSRLTLLRRLYLASLDASSICLGSKNLEEVTLHYMTVPGVAGPLLHSLSESKGLWKLETSEAHSPETVSILADLLGALSQLEKLRLWAIDFGDLVIDFSHMVRLKELGWDEVAMTEAGWMQLIQSLPKNQAIVRLINCNVGEECMRHIQSSPRFKVSKWPDAGAGADATDAARIIEFQTVL